MSSRIIVATCLLLIPTTSGCRDTTAHASDWSYEGATGPEHWGDLKPAYVLAKTGRRQSPIDIVVADTAAGDLDPLVVSYHDTSIDLINNGHTIQDDYHGGGHIKIGGHEYTLTQFHFHSPSEHTIDGKHSAMEMHLVHKDAGGTLAVLAVMINEGKENAQFARLSKYVPKTPGRTKSVEGVSINAADLLPKSQANYRYTGSLTTPPCSEDVSWVIFKEPIEASKEQIENFREIIFRNNRPTQPLNGRTVKATR